MQKARGGEVEVRVSGRIRPLVGPIAQLRGRCRPLRMGASVAHLATTAGTAGLFVQRPGGPTSLLMSNNHVLANVNKARIGDPILQPARSDSGNAKTDLIGTLYQFMPLQRDGINLADCALCELQSDIPVDSAGLPDGVRLEGVASVPPDELLGADVGKTGRSTGTTRGTVSAVNMRPRVWYGRKRLEFAGQFEVEGVGGAPFSGLGDSGSLVYQVSGGSARGLGLLFAGGGAADVTYASPLAPPLLATLDVQLAP